MKKKKRDENDNFFKKIQFLLEIYKIYLIFEAFAILPEY